MARILTIFSGSVGHYKGFARFVAANKINHDFIYASNDLKAGRSIPRFYGIPCQPAYMNNEFLMNIPLLKKLELKLENTLFLQRKFYLEKLLEQIRPDVVLLDNFNFTDALIIHELGHYPKLRVILYQTRLSTSLNASDNYGGVYKGQFAMLSAGGILRRQKRKRRMERILMPGFNDEYRIKRLINENGIKKIKLNSNRYGPPSLKYLPEIVFSNATLIDNHSTNQYFMGLGISAEGIKLNKKSWKNVMVSIGSREFIFDFTNKYVATIDSLARVFHDFKFFVPQSFEARVIGQNVRYYGWESFKTCLEQSDIHITHGGINSIKDSLRYGLPMLICPMDWKSDQIHNALIFSRLGLAEIWNISLDTKVEVQLKFESIVGSLKRQAIIDFMENASGENPVDKIQSQFSELLEDNRWQVMNW